MSRRFSLEYIHMYSYVKEYIPSSWAVLCKTCRVELQDSTYIYFYTKNPNLSTFWSAFEWKMFVYFIAILTIYGHLAYFLALWYIF
jgi:hypothetical protein